MSLITQFKFVCLSGLLSLVSIQAYGASSSDKGTVRFRVLTFERSGGLEEIFLTGEDGSPGKAVKMHKNNFSGPYTAKKRKLIFSRHTEAGELASGLVGKVSLPESLGSKVLLIALPTSKGGYAFYPMSDNFSAFSAGQFKFVNLTGVTIAGKLNAQKVKVSPRSSSPSKAFSKKQKPHSFPVEFYFAQGKKWMPFSSNFWRHEPDVRSIVFFYRDPKTKRIRIRSIPEIMGKP